MNENEANRNQYQNLSSRLENQNRRHLKYRFHCQNQINMIDQHYLKMPLLVLMIDQAKMLKIQVCFLHDTMDSLKV